MSQYTYAYRVEQFRDETFFRFPKLPGIITSVSNSDYSTMDANEIRLWTTNAVITDLQAHMSRRAPVPEGDNPKTFIADGFVSLPILHCMKLELYKIYLENSKSVAEFSRILDKPETSIRRMLDLRHNSVSHEIEEVVAQLGKQIIVNMDLIPELLPRPSHVGKPIVVA